MAVAQRKYEYSDLDYDEKDYEREKIVKKSSRPKNNTKTLFNIKKATYIKVVAVAFVCCTILLSKNVIINEKNYELLKLKNQLIELRKVNEQLKVEIESSIDINAIERSAVERLNMQYPDTKQITYLQLAKSDFTDVKKINSKDKESEGTILDTIKKGLMQVVGYLY